jgi:outer membrane protein insertion porin family
LGAANNLKSQDLHHPLVRGVQVSGNARIPTDTILHYVSSVPGNVYDADRAGHDLRKLFDLGVFQSLDIQTRDAGLGQIDVIYRVHELPFVSEFVIEGVGPAEDAQIRRMLETEKLIPREATPYRPATVVKAANVVRDYFRARKYPFAEVRVLTEDGKGNTTRVRLSVTEGPHLAIGEVRFSGNTSIPSEELLSQFQQSRPAPLYAPWMSQGAYLRESLAEDLERLRRHYQSRGFAEVSVGEPQIFASNFTGHWWIPLPGLRGAGQKLTLVIPIVEGPRFSLESVKLEGNAKAASSDVAKILASIKAPADYDSSKLEAARQKMVEAVGHEGYALALVQLEQAVNDKDRTVRSLYRITAGDPVAIGRIEFKGTKRIPDKFLRRELVPREGEVFDSAKIDKTIKRLNRSGMVKALERSDVALEMNERTEALDITFKVKEKDRQGVYGTGGTGGIGGGYLGALYSAFNLLGLGESLTLQMDGGAAQSNMLLNIVGSRFLGFPFTLGLSIFHRLTNVNIASILPDATDLVHLLRQNSTGARLSGAYPLTTKMQVGLSSQFERLTVADDVVGGSSGTVTTVQRRTDLSPSFVFNSTQGDGPATRGFRFTTTDSWSGSLFLRSIDTTAQSVGLSEYVADPITSGRNSFAFRLQGAITRPQDNVPLPLDRRFFPGDEILRGFKRGNMAPWAFENGSQTDPTPVGADTVLAFSMEYRIPIQGPLSAAAFADFGWSGLSSKSSSLDQSFSLIEETNRLLRASVGAEFRLQLPVIHQPGRLIFSYNPLRLDRLIHSGGSPLRLADPRGTIHFALGDLF